MIIEYIIEHGDRTGEYYAGDVAYGRRAWTKDLGKAMRFPGSWEASNFATSRLGLDDFKTPSVVTDPLASEEESEFV